MKSKIRLVALCLGLSFLSLQLNAQEKVITKEALPKEAQRFLNEHFSGQKIIRLTEEKEGPNKKEYEAYLENNVKVEFDTKGNWKEVDGNNTVIPTKFISKKITRHIGQKFPNQKITKIEKSPYKFEVKLSDGTELEFDAKGNFTKFD